jgi:arylsulfatase A-like enzyme
MKRRDFIRYTATGTAMAAFSPMLMGLGKHHKRPNILYIMSDDHAAQAISCYGSRINQTPNIDRLAAEGMKFENCFCTNSICTPSRASILTGKYSHKNGCRTLDDVFDPNQLTFPKLLQQAGYHTGIVGKWHLGTEPTGFDYYNVLHGQGDYFNPYLKEKKGRWRMGERGGKRYPGYVTDVITDLALQFLENRLDNRPFCLLYQHKAPHDMWEYKAVHAELFSDRDIPEPVNLFDDYSGRGEAIKRTTQKIGMEETLFLHETQGDQFEGIGGQLEALPPAERNRQVYQHFIKAYLRCVASIDENIGRMLDYLDASGLAENTIVIYTSDQGFFLGEHGLFDKRFMYEESLRMPFIVRYPREMPPGSVNDNIALNIDFAETFLDYAGVDVPAEMQGRSLRPLFIADTPADWRTSMYYRYWMHRPHFDVAAHFGVRTERYKLIYYYGLPLDAAGALDKPTPPEWELFDLQNDPHEMQNVYHEPSHSEVVAQLKTELRRLRKQYADDQDGIEIL